MNRTENQIARQFRDRRGDTLYLNDLDTLARKIAEAAPVEFLTGHGYEGLWNIAAILRMSPKSRHLLKEKIKLVKLDEIIRIKTAAPGPVQQELFLGSLKS